MNYLLNALVDKLEGEAKVHKANIMVYMENPTGIGDHPGDSFIEGNHTTHSR